MIAQASTLNLLNSNDNRHLGPVGLVHGPL